jgi:hypothetical protein
LNNTSASFSGYMISAWQILKINWRNCVVPSVTKLWCWILSSPRCWAILTLEFFLLGLFDTSTLLLDIALCKGHKSLGACIFVSYYYSFRDELYLDLHFFFFLKAGLDIIYCCWSSPFVCKETILMTSCCSNAKFLFSNFRMHDVTSFNCVFRLQRKLACVRFPQKTSHILWCSSPS